MENNYIEDKLFEKINFSESPLKIGHYENCKFVNCNFANADLSKFDFISCDFKDCNLSMAKVVKTAMQKIKFNDCKLLGLHFENCNSFLFEVSFENCILNLSSFYMLKLKKTLFKNSSLHEVDFSGTDLSLSIFENCDLKGVLFENTILEKVDFRTSYNYTLDPELNRIKKAKFSRNGISGLLVKYDIEIE